MAAPGTTGSDSTLSRLIRFFLAQPLDVIRSIRSSYSSNNVYVLPFQYLNHVAIIFTSILSFENCINPD